jgi:hypothetical protein
MIHLIHQVEGWQNKTAEQIATELNTPSVVVTDDQLYTWAGVALIAGPVGAESLRLALDANGMGWVVHQLGGSGIQLSNEQVQQVLLGFAQAGIPGMAELAAIGKSLVSPAAKNGFGTVTAGQVQSAIDDSRLTNAKALFAERMTVGGDAQAIWAQAWEDAGA